MTLERYVTASDKLAACLTQFGKGLEADRAEMALLKGQEAHVDAEKMDSEKTFAEIRAESEQRMVQLDAALVRRSWAETLTTLPLTEY